jgi:2-polyprenyl-3-methyl-5-hydroxy-6-metoxy-1,4-benzoquinol methylase
VLISDEYRRLNYELHQKGNYGISGAKYAADILRLTDAHGFRSILDYGCGKGLLKKALDGHCSAPIVEYDPAFPEKADLPKPADLVVCGDVLEHVEPECLEAVLDHIRDLAKRAVFLVIATRHASKHLSDGRNAHLIVEPASWWMPKLQRRWLTGSFMGNAGELVFCGMSAV